MKKESKQEKGERAPLGRARAIAAGVGLVIVGGGVAYLATSNFLATEYTRAQDKIAVPTWPLPLNKDAYNARMLALAHYVPPPQDASSTASSTLPLWTATTSVSVGKRLWPTPAAYPQGGAILPFHRIVAYYGNFYSRQMGVLGEYAPDEVLAKLASTTAEWAAADPSTPVVPAVQYIAVVAQGAPGKDGKWRARMPDEEIDKALAMAEKMNGLLILDVQVGQSTLPQELPLLEKYLSMPNVELAIDPEFSMKYGNPPGTVIGTFDASDINYAATYLASLVREHQLPPKVLVVHRFTYDMVTNIENVQPLPEVEVVMDMDGWGSQAKKIGTYTHVIAPYPVEFTGMKLFYHADLKPPSTGLLTMEQVLSLTPAPIYIQYQ